MNLLFSIARIAQSALNVLRALLVVLGVGQTIYRRTTRRAY